MHEIDSIEALEALYGSPGAPALRKVARQMTPLYRKWIMASRFCVLSTVGPDGTDGSPRGDDGPAVLELDPGKLAMPDWRGNNRLDSLRNVVLDGRVSLTLPQRTPEREAVAFLAERESWLRGHLAQVQPVNVIVLFVRTA